MDAFRLLANLAFLPLCISLLAKVMNEEASVVTAILLATTTVLVEIHILDEVLTKRKQGARMVTRATRMAVIISQLREGWPCVPVPTQKELTSTQMARGS